MGEEAGLEERVLHPKSNTTVSGGQATSIDISERSSCPECRGRIIFYPEKKEFICDYCGLVQSESNIDMGAEWRSFEPGDDHKLARTGPIATLVSPTKGLASGLSYSKRDAHGKPVPNNVKDWMYRVHKLERRTHSKNSAETNMQKAGSTINRVASAMHLKRPTRESAAYIYRRLVTTGKTNKRPIEALAVAALYLGCRQDSVDCCLEDFLEHTTISRKILGRTVKHFIRELKLPPGTSDAASYLGRICDKLKVDYKVLSLAQDLLRQANDDGILNGKLHVGGAAGAIYKAAIACGQRRSEREVADAAGITEPTVRARYRDLARYAVK